MGEYKFPEYFEQIYAMADMLSQDDCVVTMVEIFDNVLLVDVKSDNAHWRECVRRIAE